MKNKGPLAGPSGRRLLSKDRFQTLLKQISASVSELRIRDVCYRQVSLAQPSSYPTPNGTCLTVVASPRSREPHLSIPSPRIIMPDRGSIIRRAANFFGSAPKSFPNAVMVRRYGKTAACAHSDFFGVFDMHVEIVLADFNVDAVVGRLIARFELGLFSHVVHLPKLPPCTGQPFSRLV